MQELSAELMGLSCSKVMDLGPPEVDLQSFSNRALSVPNRGGDILCATATSRPTPGSDPCSELTQLDVRNDNLPEAEQSPQPPPIATKVLRVLSRDDATLSEISNLIRADAALSARLLRVANSALYAFPSPITTIQRAVMVLGFDELKRFVVTFV
jgi:hypothetical protein